MMEEVWDVARDLPFLIDRDEGLNEEMALVGHLQRRQSGEQSHSISPPSRTSESFEARRRLQVCALHAKVKMLQAKLEERRFQASFMVSSSRWERIARRQRHEARKAMLERADLKQSVQANKTLILHLQSLVHKKARRQARQDDWRAYKLTAEPSLRHTAMHAIAERQYSRKDTEFINTGLMGPTENLFRLVPLNSIRHGTLRLESVIRLTLSAPCDRVGRAAWEIFNGTKTPAFPAAQTTLEHVDDCTLYEQFHETRDGVTSHASTIRKYFVRDNLHVIVWRSGLDDELGARRTTRAEAVEDQSGWIEIEPIGETQCRLTFLMHFAFDMTAFPMATGERGVSVHEFSQALERLQVDESMHQDGSYPTVVAPFDKMTMPRGYDTFFDRGVRFNDALQAHVNALIHAF
ncbi:unnamed protein product [Aphanomyces euteiches]